MDGVAGGPARERVGDLDLPIGCGVHEVGAGQLVQRVVQVDAERGRGRVQIVAMGLPVIAEIAQHDSVQLPDRWRKLLGRRGDRLGCARGRLGH